MTWGAGQVFIGQIDLADLAGTVVGRQFPAAGLLSLFGHPDGGSTGAALLTPPGTPLVRVEVLGEHGPAAPRANLRLVETLRLPAMHGELAAELGIGPEEHDRLSDLLVNWNGAVDVLGGHPVAYHTGHNVLRNNPGSVQMAMFTPDGGWAWADGHILTFTLPAADLKAGDLSRLRVVDG